MKRLTLSMPCFGRPERTIRAINCIANQNINGWEALVIGDGCPVMRDYIESEYFAGLIDQCSYNGNNLIIENNPVNQGGHGFAITNNNIKIAKGEYFVFFANDDIILPNHFENYLSQIEGSDLDFVYCNTIVAPINSLRSPSLQYGSIGHSELIVRTEFLRQMPIHDSEYGHDWQLIENMAKVGKHKKALNCPPTYYVMSLSDKREEGIE
jgi:glycosyltransferase involved in cell wall biosynthesis